MTLFRLRASQDRPKAAKQIYWKIFRKMLRENVMKAKIYGRTANRVCNRNGMKIKFIKLSKDAADLKIQILFFAHSKEP
jgi:hypothetical protein